MLGLYGVRLTVADGDGGTAVSRKLVAVVDNPPVAHAGPDQSLHYARTVQLEGSGTDPENAPLSCQWSFVQLPPGSTPSFGPSASVCNPSFYADQVGDYVAQLVVNDGAQDSAPDTVLISALNAKPVADAGPTQTVAKGSLVQSDAKTGAYFLESMDAVDFAHAEQHDLIAYPVERKNSIPRQGPIR